MAIAKALRDLKRPTEYYALSIREFGRSICVETFCTMFREFSENGNEIREPQLHCDNVSPLETLGERWSRVNKNSELLDYLASGGHSLIAREILTAWWPNFLSPIECFRYSQGAPFLAVDYLPPGAEEPYPPPFIRKHVMARDGYRCRKCGHSPEDHPAIKLEIHHVLERSRGGLTITDNLVTLCKSCHDDARPPDPWLRNDLFSMVDFAAGRYHRRNYAQGVETYREWAGRTFAANKEARELEDPIEDLTWEEYHDPGKRDLAYRILTANSVARYLAQDEWRRILPRELKQAPRGKTA